MLPVPSAVARSSVGWENPMKSAESAGCPVDQLVERVLAVGSRFAPRRFRRCWCSQVVPSART